MKNQYNRPTLSVFYWLVNKNDLKKFYTFLEARHNSKKILFELETKSGNNREYESFQEFENDIACLESNKEKVELVKIGCSHDDINGRGHIWVNINFNLQQNNFHIIGNDTTGGKKDWVDGAYEEMQRICKSFEIEDKSFQIELKNKFGRKYTENVLVEDFNGLRKVAIEEEIKEKKSFISNSHQSNISNSLQSKKKNWWDKFFSNSWIQGIGYTVIGGFILYWIIEYFKK